MEGMSNFFRQPSFEARGSLEEATVIQGMPDDDDQGTSKKWRGFIDKTEARLVPVME